MNKCDIQLDIIREDVETYLWTFRWIWIINLAAIVWGIVRRRYDIVVLAAVSALVAMVGAARTRRGRRLVDKATSVCITPRAGEVEPDVG